MRSRTDVVHHSGQPASKYRGHTKSFAILARSLPGALLLLMSIPMLAQTVRELVPSSAPIGARVLVTGRGLADPNIAVAFGSFSANILQRWFQIGCTSYRSSA